MTRILEWIICVLAGAVIVLAVTKAPARDLDGKYAQSPLQKWFNSLTNQQKVPCCDTADGRRVEDADWETKGDGYRVRIDGKWMDVPESAVITQPNRAGSAIVWPYESMGQTFIRCFIPGTLT